jgi:hypothetical protein
MPFSTVGFFIDFGGFWAKNEEKTSKMSKK